MLRELFTLKVKTLFLEIKMFSNFQSTLYNQDNFYENFIKDLRYAKSRVIIESPFITERRMSIIMPVLVKLRRRGIKITVNTKPYEECEPKFRNQTISIVNEMHNIGIDVLFTNGHHRKIAVIDSDVLYEGSLNILSQNDSCEIMRRIQDEIAVIEMLKFTGLRKWCK